MRRNAVVAGTLRGQREARDGQPLAGQPRAHQFRQHLPGGLGHHGVAEDRLPRALQTTQQLEGGEIRLDMRRRRSPGPSRARWRMFPASSLATSANSRSATESAGIGSRALDLPQARRTLESVSDRLAQRGGLDGLQQIVAGLESDRGDRRVHCRVTGDEDDLQPAAGREFLAQARQELDTVGHGHPDVAHHHVRLRSLPQPAQCLVSGMREAAGEVIGHECPFGQRKRPDLVIDEQHPRLDALGVHRQLPRPEAAAAVLARSTRSVQLDAVDRLYEHVVGSCIDGRLSGRLVVHAGQDHDWQVAARACEVADFPAQLQPIHSRHPQVDDRHVGYLVRQQRERGLTAADCAHLVAAEHEQLLQQIATAGIVVHHEGDLGSLNGHEAALAIGTGPR